MRYMSVLWILSALFALSAASGAAQCYRCDDCDFTGEHKNVVTETSIAGNLDGEHGCFPYSCETMFGQGIHQPEHACDSFAAHEAAKDAEVLTVQAADQIAERFPHHVRFTTDRRAIQILNCDGSGVHSEFVLRERVIRS